MVLRVKSNFELRVWCIHTLSFIILYTLFSSITLHAQNNKIGKYFELTNRAEMNIIHSNYQDALSLYNEAFKLNVLGKDYVNAFLCSYIMRDSVYLEHYSNLLCKKGLDFDRQFSDCLDIAFLEYLQDFKECETPKDSLLTLLLDSLGYRDQITRKEDQFKESINKFDTYNQELLTRNFINGLPGFDSFGFLLNKGVTMNMSCPIIMVIHHNRGADNKALDSILLSSLYEGTIHPEVIAGLWLHRNSKVLGLSFPLADSIGLHIWNYPNWDTDKIRQMDVHRQRYYLPSCADSYEKYNFFLDNYSRTDLVGQFCILKNTGPILDNQQFIFD